MADEPPPKYSELTFQAIHAAGFLWCDGHLCCERGSWTGNPVFLRGKEVGAVSRQWYRERMMRVRRGDVPFFPAQIEPHPADPGLPKKEPGQ